MGCPYYIYDNFNEEFYSTSFTYFDDAETAMECLKKEREKRVLKLILIFMKRLHKGGVI